MIALILAFLCYRKDVPMTMRSCFEPLIGDKVYGLFGDIVDILTVMCTMFGVCTSLGIGSNVISGGIARLNIGFELTKTNQIIVIWAITAVATLSVVSGVKVGIRRLSEIAFAMGMLVWFYVLFCDDTWYILNLFVQSCGYYLQWVVQLGFHTGAFEQLGDAPDQKQAPEWMGAWTVFYWGWWIAWAPLVGIFIAKISRGRTIRGFLNFTLTIPIVYCLMWFCVFGGAGLRMERAAAAANITCTSPFGGGKSNSSFQNGQYVGGIYRLSCRSHTDMFFDVINQYSTVLPGFLTGFSVLTMVLYFVTSSDSGSLVIDSISANGHPDPPIPQRVFWALTEGATASALVAAGSSEKVLAALQSVSICSGLIYTVILNFVCVALWRLIKIEAGDLDPNGPQFSLSLLDLIYYPTPKRVGKLVIAIFAPWWSIGKAAGKVYGSNRCAAMLMLAIPFYGWIILQICQVFDPALGYIGWALLFGFIAYGTGVRAHIREKYEINGNLAEDMFAMMLMYPLAAVQMEDHMHVVELMKKDDTGECNDTSISMEYIKDKKLSKNGIYYVPTNGKPLDHSETTKV